MQFLVLNDHEHPFRLFIQASVMKLFSENLRNKRFFLDLDLFWRKASELGMSQVEKDFIIENGENSLLIFISSIHYLHRRNQHSSSILRMFDFNFYSQKIGFHDIVNQEKSGFVKVPSYPLNLCFSQSGDSRNSRFQMTETDIHEFSHLNKQNCSFSVKQSYKIKQQRNIGKNNIQIRDPTQKILNIHNLPDLHFLQNKMSIYISRVQSLRHNPFPEKWFSKTRELRKIPWIQSKYQIEFPTIHSLISESSKLRTLDNLLKRLKKQKHRVLIFCQMTKMMNIIEDYLQFKKYKYYRLDGGSGINERRDMVDGFQNRDDVFVFLLSTRAGGLGVTLTAADDVIFYDNDWNPTMDAQAEDRAHRIGK